MCSNVHGSCDGVSRYAGNSIDHAVYGSAVCPEIVQTNLLLNSIYTNSRHIGIQTTDQFLFALGVLVFALLVTSLAFKALTTYAQTRFALMREYSFGKRLVEATFTSLTAGS